MDEHEFDKIADEYRALHATNIALSGEGPDYFAEYKVLDLAGLLGDDVDRPLRILDFGAGVGTSVPWFRKHLPKAEVTCLDVSRKSLELGESSFRSQARFIHFDGATVPFPEASFEIAFVACVLHHIDHAEHPRILRELNRVLAPKGRLIIFEHNPRNPLTVHAVNTCPFDQNAVLLRSSSLRARVTDAGFEAVLRKFRVFFPGFARVLRPMERYLTWMPLGAQYYVTGTKSADA